MSGDFDNFKLDHRLLKLEGGMEEIKALLKAENGRIGLLEKWRSEVALATARSAGIVEGRTGVRKQQVAFLLTFVTIAGSLGGLIVSLIGKL